MCVGNTGRQATAAAGADSESAQFASILDHFEAYNAALLQVHVFGSALADELTKFYSPAHPYRPFIDSFKACQSTMKAVAHDLLTESFAKRIQEPIAARQAKVHKLQRIEELRDRLWSRYIRHSKRLAEMSERDRALRESGDSNRSGNGVPRPKQPYSITSLLKVGAKKAFTKDPPLAEDTRKLRMVVDDELKLHQETMEHLQVAWKSLSRSATAFLDPAIAAVTALQSQTANLHSELLAEVVQRSPDTMETSENLNTVITHDNAREETLEAMLTLILSSPTSDQAGISSSMGSLSSIEDLDESSDVLGDSSELAAPAECEKTESPHDAEEPGSEILTGNRSSQENSTEQYDSQDDKLMPDHNTSSNMNSVSVDMNEAPPLAATRGRAASVGYVTVADSEAESTDEEDAMKRFHSTREQSRGSLATVEMSGHCPESEKNTVEEEFGQPRVVSRAKAMYDFEPNHDMELSFVKGDVLEVLVVNNDGWYEARDRNGNVGLVPFLMLCELPPAH